MYMCVNEFECALFENEIKNDVYYVKWWAVLGKKRFVCV